MKVSDLLQEDPHHEATKARNALVKRFDEIRIRYPKAQVELDKIKNVDTFAYGNMEGRYRVDNIVFDNEYGLGATPNNSNVLYKGFVTMLTPDQFLKLAADGKGTRDDDAIVMKKLIESGFAIAAPFLEIELEDEPVSVQGHEGRARMMAIQKIAGNIQIPVQVYPRFYRARHITEKYLRSFGEIGLTPQNGGTPIKLHEIYLDGQRHIL